MRSVGCKMVCGLGYVLVTSVAVSAMAQAEAEVEGEAEAGKVIELDAKAETDAAASTAADAASTTQGAKARSDAPPPVVHMNAGAAVAGGPRGSAGAGTSGQVTNYGGPVTNTADVWKFSYNGYFRAPLRVGIGKRAEAVPGGQPVFSDQSKTTLEMARIPDNQYQSWQYTKSNQGPWAEMFFGMGNQWAKGTVAVGAFNFTDSSFNDNDDQGAQVGINQAWVTLTPDTNDLVESSKFTLHVGSHSSRYGQAGKYDAGAYDTFAFGRTHVMGYTARAEKDFDDLNFWLEQGFGARQADPSPYLNTKFTLLNHFHAGINYGGELELGLHYLNSWTQEPDHACVAAAPGSCEHLSNGLANLGDGSMVVYGIEGRLNTSTLGDLYLAFSRIQASDAASVGGAIEVIHAPGGGFFDNGIVGQYLGGAGNGSINNIFGQYEVSLSSLIGPDLFGEASLTASVFGMLNFISSDEAAFDGIRKQKYGAHLIYNPISWFGVGFRGDRVEPNDKIAQQSFSVLSPHLIFRSSWATHEQITIGYSRYVYAERECDDARSQVCVQTPNGTVYPDGLGASPGGTEPTQSPLSRGAPQDPNDPTSVFTPHEDVFKIEASMWW